MVSEVDQFLNTWLFDVRRHLERIRDYAKEDLLYGDEAEQERASEKIAVITDLLPRSLASREEMAAAVMQDGSLTPAERIAEVDAILHPKRKRGRPQTETVQNAIYALSLYRKGKSTLGVINKKPGKKWSKRRLGATGRMDWREIAMKVIGCNHKGRTATKSCHSCGEAIEQAVCRLKRTLKEIDALPPTLSLPRTLKELDKEIGLP